MTNESRIRIVEALLDGEVIQCPPNLNHSEPSNIIFESVVGKPCYFRPCKNHLELFREILLENAWREIK